MARLGLIPSPPDPRTPRLRDAIAYAQTSNDFEIQASPSSRIWTRPLLAVSDAAGHRYGKPFKCSTWWNLKVGSCTGATYGFIDRIVSGQLGIDPVVTDDVVRDYYMDQGWGGPDHPTEGDNGAKMEDALKWFMKLGVIDAYAEVDLTDRKEIQTAINLTQGGLALALALPQSMFVHKQLVWDTAPSGKRDSSYVYGSWGNHSVAGLSYDERGLALGTWGNPEQWATYEFIASYHRHGHGYAVLHRALARTPAGKLTPSGYTAQAIRRILGKVDD